MDLSSYFTSLQQPGPNNASVSSPFPNGYTSPAAIKAMYDYSNALLKNSEQPVPGTKGGWTVGVQHLVDALMGGQQAYQANQNELGSRGYDASQYPAAPGAVPNNNKSDSASSKKTASAEDAHSYSADGSSTRGQRNNNPGNIEDGAFARSLPGYVGSDGRFAIFDSPESGKAAIDKLLTAYGNKGVNTPEAIAARWAPPSDNNNTLAYASTLAKGAGVTPNTPLDMNDPNVRSKISNGINVMENGSAATNPITVALSKGAKAPTVTGVPSGENPSTVVAPFAVPQRPQVDRSQYEHLMASPWLPDAQKTQIQQWYMEQHQPIGVPYLGGNAIVNPQNPKQQFFSPGIHWGTTKGPGGSEVPTPQTILPPGYGAGPPTIKTLDEPGAQTPTGAPSGQTPPPITPLAPITVPQVPQTPQSAPQGAAPPPNATGAASSPALAFAGAPNAAPVAQAVAAAPPAAPPVPETPNQVLTSAEGNVAPPPVAPPVPTGQIEPMGDKAAAALGAAPPPAAGTQVAENVNQKLHGLMDLGLQYEQKKAINSADATQYLKDLQSYTDVGIRANKAIPSLEIAQKMLQDPRYYSGLLSDPYRWLQQAKAGLAFAGLGPNESKAAAAPMEIFDKILSGNIVTELKTQLAGLGQIRLAEINLITQSVANKYNTPAANAAVLMMMQRENRQAANIGNIATQYGKGWTLNDKDQWVRNTGVPTTSGLQEQINAYTTRHPLFRDDEIKNIQHVFDISQKTENPNAPFAKTKAELEGAANHGLSTPAEAAEQPKQGENPQTSTDYEKTKTLGGTTYGFKGGNWYPITK